ncbi:MAG: DNA methyltransferase, partial [Melioribacteraceae bacterium]
GIFYTPKYITKYIVDNTIGSLCNEKKKELKLDEIDETILESSKTQKGKLNQKAKILFDNLDKYREYILSLKILDPACGSGAFLNQALEFLIKEHKWIDEHKSSLLKEAFTISEYEKEIVENNIYGVDINEEAVEIAKLSLWLRTAKKGRKLSTLSNNIKCGNSLIDDPKVAGNKAFNWNEEFKEIMSNGGFDVVIGNPPYVRVQSLKHDQIDWYKEKKRVAYKRVDISILFFELAKEILKEQGLVSFITSKQFITAEYGAKVRMFIKQNYQIQEIVDFNDLPIFKEALTYVAIFTLKNSLPMDFLFKNIVSFEDVENLSMFKQKVVIEIKSLNEKQWLLTDQNYKNLFYKINQFEKLNERIAKCNYGIVTGNDKVFNLTIEKAKNLKIEKDILLPLIRAENCERFGYSSYDSFVIYPYKLSENSTSLFELNELKNKFPNAYNYLNANKNILFKRKDSRKTFENRKDWYSLTRFGQLNVFNQTKIVFPGETKENKFGLDKNNAGYSGARVFSIVPVVPYVKIQYLLGILNSKLIQFYLHSIAPLKKGGYFSYSSNIINNAPIVYQYYTHERLAEVVENIIGMIEEKKEKINKFLNRIKDNFEFESISKKLQSFYDNDFKQFRTELKKQKVILSLKQQDEWEEYFNEYKTKINQLQEEITKTDNEIDVMVYKLYNLNYEEVKIVDPQFWMSEEEYNNFDINAVDKK